MRKCLFILLLIFILPVQAQYYSVKPILGVPINGAHQLAHNLVGCWLAGHGGNMALDLVGHNNGTFVGNTHLVPGKFGEAWDFDGSGDVIDFGSTGAALIQAQPAFTITFWVKLDANLPNLGGMISAAQTSAFPFGFRESGAHTDGTMDYQQYSYSSLYSTRKIGKELNVWIHVTLVFSSVGFRAIYFDGQLDNSDTHSTPIQNNGDKLYLGCDYTPGASRDMNGQITHLMIWQRALTASEIRHLYQKPFCLFEQEHPELYVSSGEEPTAKPRVMIIMSRLLQCIPMWVIFIMILGFRIAERDNVEHSG